MPIKKNVIIKVESMAIMVITTSNTTCTPTTWSAVDNKIVQVITN